MRKIEHWTIEVCINDSLKDNEWTHSNCRIRDKYLPRGSNRLGGHLRGGVWAPTKSVREPASLIGKSGFYTVNDTAKVACNNHCGTYVKGSSNAVEERTYHRLDYLPCRRRAKIGDQSDQYLHWMSNDNELIRISREGKNIQRNVNLSPGIAPETSHSSSRTFDTVWVNTGQNIKTRTQPCWHGLDEIDRGS